jgi:DNA-directed RNA polymerase specialized sigma24 family protein
MTEPEIIAALHGSDAEKSKILAYLLFERRDHFIRKIAYFLQVDPNQDGFEDAFVEALYSFSNNISAYNPQKSSMVGSWARFTWQRFFTWRRSESRRNERQLKVAAGSAAALKVAAMEPDAPGDILIPVITAMANDGNSAAADANLLAREQADILEALLRTIGPSCQEALVLWSMKVPHKEIARLLKIKNPADKIKNCQRQLRNWLAAHPSVTDYFRTS